jgi:hypothetical protein
VELFLLELRVGSGLLLLDPRDLPREHRGDRVHERGEDQGALGAEEPVDADGRQAADEAPDDADDRQTRVGAHELALAADQRGHERAPGDRVRLLRHEQTERERVDQQGLGAARVHVSCDEEAEDAAGRARDEDHEPPATSDPVEQRAQQRRDDREGRHRDDQVQQHLLARLTGRHREEQGPGQRDGQAHVAADARGVGDRKSCERRRLGETGIGRAGRRRTTRRRCRGHGRSNDIGRCPLNRGAGEFTRRSFDGNLSAMYRR